MYKKTCHMYTNKPSKHIKENKKQHFRIHSTEYQSSIREGNS